MIKKIYKILFSLFYIIPAVTIIIKLIEGYYYESLLEIWFLGLLIVISLIILLLPRITKKNKEIIIFAAISFIVFFFGLGSLDYNTKFIIVDFSDISAPFRIPYIVMFVIDCILLLGILGLSLWYKYHNTSLEN